MKADVTADFAPDASSEDAEHGAPLCAHAVYGDMRIRT